MDGKIYRDGKNTDILNEENIKAVFGVSAEIFSKQDAVSVFIKPVID